MNISQPAHQMFCFCAPGELLRQPVDAVSGDTLGAEAFPDALLSTPPSANSPTSSATTSTTTAAAADSASLNTLVPGNLKQLQVLVNTVLSSCKSPNATTCSFSYSAAATPSVSAVSPESLAAGGVLTVEGAGFDAGEKLANRVWLGGAPCVVMAATASSIRCRIALNTTAGWHEVGANQQAALL
jgi:hypothetical protein